MDEQGGYDAPYAYDQHVDYGQVVGTRRHRSITNGVYELPFGRGKRFLGQSGPIADLAVGGRQLTAILGLQSGLALTAYMPPATLILPDWIRLALLSAAAAGSC